MSLWIPDRPSSASPLAINLKRVFERGLPPADAEKVIGRSFRLRIKRENLV